MENQKTREEQLRELENERTRAKLIVQELSNCTGFQYLLDDLKKSQEMIDANWHLIPTTEPKHLEELRITKLATASLINILLTYENKVQQLDQKIKQIEQPENYILADYDNE